MRVFAATGVLRSADPVMRPRDPCDPADLREVVLVDAPLQPHPLLRLETRRLLDDLHDIRHLLDGNHLQRTMCAVRWRRPPSATATRTSATITVSDTAAIFCNGIFYKKSLHKLIFFVNRRASCDSTRVPVHPCIHSSRPNRFIIHMKRSDTCSCFPAITY